MVQESGKDPSPCSLIQTIESPVAFKVAFKEGRQASGNYKTESRRTGGTAVASGSVPEVWALANVSQSQSLTHPSL